MRFTARNLDPTVANRIHDDDVARQFGFPGALVPGVDLWGCAAALLAEQWGPGWLRGGRLALRFRRPTADGAQVALDLAEGGGLVLRTDDGEARAVGTASTGGPVPVVDPADWPVVPPPAALRPAEPASLPPGPLPTVDDPALAAATAASYAERIGTPAPAGALHPGLVLRAVNRSLMQTVDLGPWIHTASDAVWLAPAPVGSALQVRAVVRGTQVRGGHDEVRYDALVLAAGVPVLLVDHTALFRLQPPA